MIFSEPDSRRARREVRAVTMIELMTTVAIAGILAAMIFAVIGSQPGKAKDRTDYLQYRDDVMAAAKPGGTKWNYNKPSDPSAGRLIAGLEFDPSVKIEDLHNLWLLIQPHFHMRFKMMELDELNFNDSLFRNNWFTNIIGIDKKGYPYRLEGLEYIQLENTHITNDGLRFLYQHDKRIQPSSDTVQASMAKSYPMSSLKKINLYGCKGVSKKGVAELKKAFPGIIVITTWDPTPPGS